MCIYGGGAFMDVGAMVKHTSFAGTKKTGAIMEVVHLWKVHLWRFDCIGVFSIQDTV